VQVDNAVVGVFDADPTKPIRISLIKGEHSVKVDFLNRTGTLVYDEPTTSVEIQAGQVTIVSILITEGPLVCNSGNLVGSVRMETSRFQLLGTPVMKPLDAKTLKLVRGGASIKGFTSLIIKDNNREEPVSISVKFVFDDGLFHLVEAQPNLVYKGNSSGRWICYEGTKREGKVIFAGHFVTFPKDGSRLVLSPDAQQILEFTNPYRLEGNGRGRFEGSCFKGTGGAELHGDVFLIDTNSEFFRER
jgi:hypothetical protein